MNYQIITDATADLSQEVQSELPSIAIIPMQVLLDGTEYLYGPNGTLDNETFYSALRAGSFAGTTRISPYAYEAYFRKFLEQGLDLLYLCFSTGLSGTYQSALLAVQELQQQFPERKILCVDTLAASTGEGLMVYDAAIKQAQGMELEELYRWVQTNKMQMCHWFTVDSLSYLKRGGRIGIATEKVGTMLQIKPLLHIDSMGRLEVVEKPRGRKQAFARQLTKLKDGWMPELSQTIFIGHGGNRALAEALAALVTQSLPQAHIEITYIGPVIGTHTGPDMLSLCYWGNNR